MPRTKGSKNKASLPVEEKISQITAEIETLQEQIKDKKAELKVLNAAKLEQENRKVLDAFTASGKSAEEIIAMINGIAESESGQESE